jgi:voltage-gated potassium channel
LLGLDARLPSTAYTVVYGSHPVVTQVISELASIDRPVVLVASARPAGLREGVHFVLGDPTDEEVLHSSQPERADRALIACTDDADTLIIAVTLRTCAPDLEIYAMSESARVAMALRDLGIPHTLSTTRLVSHTVAKALESPAAGEVVLELVDSPDYVMRERAVDPALAGRVLSEIRSANGGLVLAMRHDTTVDLGVTTDPVVAAGDYLIELVARPRP